MGGILGFDASLVSSGYSYQRVHGDYYTSTIKTKKLRGPERLSYIRGRFNYILDTIKIQHGTVDLIVYEGYAMGGKGRVFDIGELGGVLKLVAWNTGIDVLLVPPTSLKQFTTGKGNANKDQMIAAVASNWGYHTTQDDEADAFALLKVGEAYIKDRKPRAAIKAKALASCSIIKGKYT